MTDAGRSGRGALIAGTIVYVLLGEWPLVALAFAGLIAASRPLLRTPQVAALICGALAAGGLIAAEGLASAYAAAFVVLVTAAFVGGALLDPVPVIRNALRATTLASLVMMGLARIVWGESWWDGLRWQMSQEITRLMQPIVTLLPELGRAADGSIPIASVTLPATLALQAVAGLALAWQWHAVVSDRPLGGRLAPFGQFCFGDRWVWGLVGTLVIAIIPRLAALKLVALNVAIVLGALYLLRGVAIATVFAGAAGISSSVMVAVGIASVFLFPLLLVVLPGLWTLGVTDTWFDFRRRLQVESRP